jgi:nucleotide-binding universal stress UspA family protein
MASTIPSFGARPGGTLASVAHRTVLVPLDGSVLSEHALQPARWLAVQLGATVHMVIVGFVDDARWYAEYVRSLRHRWPQLVPHFVGDLDVAGGIGDLARTLPRLPRVHRSTEVAAMQRSSGRTW